MKFALISRLAALVVAATIACTACGGSDAAGPATDGTAADDGSVPDVRSEAVVVVESSESVDVVGNVIIPFADPNDDPAVGVEAPVVTGQTFDGTDVTIGGATSGPTMYVFLAHWCPHCNDEIPELLKLRDAGSLPDDLNVVGISTAAKDDGDNYPPSQWIVDKDWTWPVLADTEAADAFVAYGGTGFPYIVILDADGAVVARKSGNESADLILDWIQTSLQS